MTRANQPVLRKRLPMSNVTHFNTFPISRFSSVRVAAGLVAFYLIVSSCLDEQGLAGDEQNLTDGKQGLVVPLHVLAEPWVNPDEMEAVARVVPSVDEPARESAPRRIHVRPHEDLPSGEDAPGTPIGIWKLGARL